MRQSLLFPRTIPPFRDSAGHTCYCLLDTDAHAQHTCFACVGLPGLTMERDCTIGYDCRFPYFARLDLPLRGAFERAS